MNRCSDIQGGELGQLLLEALQNGIHPVETEKGTSAPLDQIAAAGELIAGQLNLAGIRKGEPVHVTIANQPDDISGFLGVWLAGGVVVPIHVSAPPTTVSKVQRLTGARYCIQSLELHLVGSEPPVDRPLLERAGLIIFTSGSTGEPKGVVIGHKELSGKVHVIQRLLKIESSDLVAVPLTLAFVFGIWSMLLTLLVRARLVLIAKPSKENLRQVLLAGATVWPTVPTMLRTVLADGAPSAPHLRVILTGGESLGPALSEAVQQAFPQAAIFDLYGLTETSSCDFCLPPADSERCRGSIGTPTEGVAFRIVGSDGVPTQQGISGELEIASPFRMVGYLDDPELTAAAFNGHYFKTGDVARLRPDGRVEILGRSKELIVRGGNKISPIEIDNVFSQHPEVAAALSAGVPDERLGETIHVAIVLKHGHQVTPEMLRSWAAEYLDRYKLPDRIHFVETLPTGRTGKADRAGVLAIGQVQSAKST